MSRYSPSVVPQYQGPNLGQSIAQALLQRDQINHQRDVDAVNTGVGLHPIDPNAAPEHSPLSRLVGGIYSRITGHANGNDVEDATANMANHPLSVGGTPNFASNETASATPPQVFTEQAPNGGRLPGAFDPMMGGFTPSQGSMMRLPSGQTVDMRMTPIGRQMQSADLQAKLTAAQLGNYQSEADARTQATERQRQTVTDRMAALKRLPQYANATDDELRGIASDDQLFTKTLDPTPKAPVMGTPEWRAAKVDEAKIGAQYGYHPPVRDHFSQVVTMGADGKPHVSVLNTTTGQVQETGALARPTGTQQSAQGAIEGTRIETARQQATQADQIMTQFEQGVQSGHVHLSAVEAELAKRAMQGGTLSEAALNRMRPDVAQYVRAAKAVASAERLITPRGGSNALMNAEAMLSGAGPGANGDLVRQAQGYRRALIGGLSQHTPMTPNDHPSGQSVPAASGNAFGDLIPKGH